jgi:hypothetical protein
MFRGNAYVSYSLHPVLCFELLLHELLVYHSSSGGTQTSIPSLSIFIPSVGAILSTFCLKLVLNYGNKDTDLDSTSPGTGSMLWEERNQYSTQINVPGNTYRV